MSEEFKISVMGEEVPFHEVPEDAPALEYFFGPVVLTPKAVDMASRVVPDEHWRALGLYTWLQGRADKVYKDLPIGKEEAQLGRLKYVFGRKGDDPTLEKVVLMP